MICRWLLLIPAITLLSLRLLRADEWTYRFTSTTADSTNADKMYEDIEIFRRILDRKLEPLYPTHNCTTFGMLGMQGSMMGMQGGMMGMQGGMMGMGGMSMMGGMPMMGSGTAIVRSLEGVYLKGQGVVYTATLASLQAPSKAAKAETTKPVSEWERVRRQLHNEKEEPKKVQASKSPTLSDVLLEVLAENGHHFSQLGDNESLTLVLTVHKSGQSLSARKSTEKSEKKASPEPLVDSPDVSKLRDLELLGDLHLKQGRGDEAMAAFTKALQLHHDSLAKAGRSSLDDPELKLQASLRRKLAQCLLQKGQDEAAHTLLDQAITLLKKAEDKQKRTPAARSAMAALPVKLIISAPKKLLHQVKEGTIAFEELRGKARVEMIGKTNETR